MDYFTIVGAILFIIGGCTIYFGRKEMTVRGRVILAAVMTALLVTIIYRAEKQAEQEEAVWDERLPQWSSAPLTVGWNRETYADYNAVFEQDIKLWNSRIGCTVLLPTKEINSANVRFHPADGSECGHETVLASVVNENPKAGISAYVCDGYFDVQTKWLAEIDVAQRAILHELGHALGLAHDARGAMAVEASAPTTSDYPEYLLPSDKDVAALNQRFCR